MDKRFFFFAKIPIDKNYFFKAFCKYVWLTNDSLKTCQKQNTFIQRIPTFLYKSISEN